MLKNWCFWTVLLEKTPESPLDSKEIKPVNLKEDQLWIFTGGTDAEAEASVFWCSDVKRWLIGKVPDAGKDGGQKEKWVSEDKMAGWHHWCNELGQTSGDGEGEGDLACCSPWGHKELDTTGKLNNSNNRGKGISCQPVQEMPETRVQSLGQEDPLEEGMATLSNILA